MISMNVWRALDNSRNLKEETLGEVQDCTSDSGFCTEGRNELLDLVLLSC